MGSLEGKNSEHKKGLWLVTLGLSIGILAFWNASTQKEAPDAFTFETNLTATAPTESDSETQKNTSAEKMYVDVKGAVEKPGLYAFSENMRIWDAVEMAGGFKADADQKQVNLALRLTDQMLVYVPVTGEIVAPAEKANAALLVPAGTTDQQQTADKINLNTADANALQTLPGIGEKKAEAILQYREEKGSFQRLEDLMEVSGIGEKVFESLKKLISIE